MGYKYSIWLIPNNWKYIQSYYKTEHIPHVTIKTLLTSREAFNEYDKLKSHYMIKYQDNVHDFDDIKYKGKDGDEIEACGFFCKIEDLELNRFIEIGYKVKMIKLSNKSIAVDTKFDLIKVKKLIK